MWLEQSYYIKKVFVNLLAVASVLRTLSQRTSPALFILEVETFLFLSPFREKSEPHLESSTRGTISGVLVLKVRYNNVTSSSLNINSAEIPFTRHSLTITSLSAAALNLAPYFPALLT